MHWPTQGMEKLVSKVNHKCVEIHTRQQGNDQNMFAEISNDKQVFICSLKHDFPLYP